MKPLRAVFTQPAAEDLDRAMEYLFSRSPLAAVRLHDAVAEMLTLLATRILRGRVATLTTGESVERWVVSSWNLYVQRDADSLVVLHVHDGRRAPIERSPTRRDAPAAAVSSLSPWAPWACPRLGIAPCDETTVSPGGGSVRRQVPLQRLVVIGGFSY